MDHKPSFDDYSPAAVAQSLAERARDRRLEANLTQRGLARRAGVSLASLKRFERTGLASLETVIRLLLALGEGTELDAVFAPAGPTTIEEILAQPARRRRGRRH